MMQSMRDKIAERLMQHYAEGGPWDGYMEADIVLDALMEPSDGMVAVCWPLHHPWGSNAPDPSERPAAFEGMQQRVRADWHAMILAAKEGK